MAEGLLPLALGKRMWRRSARRRFVQELRWLLDHRMAEYTTVGWDPGGGRGMHPGLSMSSAPVPARCTLARHAQSSCPHLTEVSPLQERFNPWVRHPPLNGARLLHRPRPQKELRASLIHARDGACENRL